MKITMNKLFDLPSKERDKIINPVFTGLLKAAYSNETIEAALRDSPLINTSVNGAKKLNRIAPSSMAKVTSFGAKASVIFGSRQDGSYQYRCSELCNRRSLRCLVALLLG